MSDQADIAENVAVTSWCRSIKRLPVPFGSQYRPCLYDPSV